MYCLEKKSKYIIINIDEFTSLDLYDLNYNGTIYVYLSNNLHKSIKSHLEKLQLSHMNRINDDKPYMNIFIIENCDYIDIEPAMLHNLMMYEDYTLCEIVPSENDYFKEV